MSEPSPPSSPKPEAAAAAASPKVEREQGLFPCTASIKEVLELCATGEPIPVVSSDVVFVSAWVVLARVRIAGREHGLGFALAGVQGPHAAMSAEHLSVVQGWLRGRSLHVHIEHHRQFPYYLYGDLAIGAADCGGGGGGGATTTPPAPVSFLSELLLREGLARFVSHSRRLAALAAAASGAAWERRWTREPSLELHGRVTRVLAGDVVELSGVAPVPRDALPFHCPLAAWVDEGCKGLGATGTVRVCLENVRCPRVGGRGAEAYAIECAEATRLLAIRQRVRVVVTSAWRNVEELQEVSVELEDSAHLRGAVYLPLEGLADRVRVAVAPTAEESQAACNAYLAGGGGGGDDGAKEDERSLGVFLSALAYPASVYPSRQTEPWAELLSPEDAMCPLSGDQAACLRARDGSGLAAYTRQLAFYNEGNPRMAVQETSLKWACDRQRLLPPLRKTPLEGIVVQVCDDVVWFGAGAGEARGGEAWKVVRATVEVRLLDAAAAQPQPQPASPKQAAADAAAEEDGAAGDGGEASAVVVDHVDVEVMEDEEDAKEQLTQKDLEREQAGDHRGEQNVERRVRFDVLILPEGAAAAAAAHAAGGAAGAAGALLADAARVAAETADAAADAEEVAEQLNVRVSLCATAVVGGKHTFFGTVSVQAFEGGERPVQAGYRRARTLRRRAHDEGVTVGDRALRRCKKSVAAFLARERVAEPAKLLEHLRVVTPALDEQSSLYLSFCPRIPSAAKARVYKADAKKVKKYSQSILETVGGIPNLSTYQFERLPASAGIFAQSPWTAILASFDAQRQREAAAAAAQAAADVTFVVPPGLLGLLATHVLRCFGETVAGHDSLVRATRLLLKRDGATGAYVVRHCSERCFLGADAAETLAERDAQAFPSVSRALPFRALHTKLAYHHTALPPWEAEEAEAEPEGADDPVLEAPMYRVGESRLHTQGGPLLFKHEHTEDVEEGGAARGGAIYLFAARGLEWGPRWAEMLGRRGLAGVAGQYRTTEARARLGLRVYGDDDKLSGVLEKSHERKQPMRHLLSLLQERAMGAPVTGVLQQFYTKPYSRVAAVYLYTIEQLVASALGSESAYNADLCAEWFPKSHDTMLPTLQCLHAKLTALVECILTDCVRKCRDEGGVDEHVVAKLAFSQESVGEKGERKIEVRAWGLATEQEVKEKVTDTFWMEGGERWSYRVKPSLDFN